MFTYRYLIFIQIYNTQMDLPVSLGKSSRSRFNKLFSYNYQLGTQNTIRNMQMIVFPAQTPAAGDL